VTRPSLPEDRLEASGWRLVEEREETLFSLPAATVEGHTVLYEDGGLRERLAAATGRDQVWRFFFATGVQFRPPLPPGVGPAMVYPSVASEAKRAFADDLRERGFRSVERGRRERARSAGGNRIRLQEYTAVLRLEAPAITVDTTGWLGVWTTGGEFRIAGGAYPDLQALDVEGPSPGDCRRELFELLRAVS
jgi:hypothetical protein